MSDTTEHTDVTPKGIDRRSALKKAAVGGAIAWSAPTVLSSKVSAVELVGACTVKCAPDPQIVLIGGTSLVCNRNGAKWAELAFALEDALCPCNSGGNAANFIGATVTPNPAEVKDVNFVPAANAGTILIGGQGQGALGRGTYTVALTYCVQCADRSQDILSRTCTTIIQFTFRPADGSCSAPGNVGEAQLGGTACGVVECESCFP